MAADTYATSPAHPTHGTRPCALSPPTQAQSALAVIALPLDPASYGSVRAQSAGRATNQRGPPKPHGRSCLVRPQNDGLRCFTPTAAPIPVLPPLPSLPPPPPPLLSLARSAASTWLWAPGGPCTPCLGVRGTFRMCFGEASNVFLVASRLPSSSHGCSSACAAEMRAIGSMFSSFPSRSFAGADRFWAQPGNRRTNLNLIVSSLILVASSSNGRQPQTRMKAITPSAHMSTPLV
mmetsp:Transcript_22185/g.51226  ORF Transcript_22185/g.51226 Transcript_22185/m.51226 type:complete len:235 (+) Transcript_22185:100-804(+)